MRGADGPPSSASHPIGLGQRAGMAPEEPSLRQSQAKLRDGVARQGETPHGRETAPTFCEA